jgi:predicted nucleotidyltransferase
MAGRRVAELAAGRLGKSRTLEVLNELVEAGVVVAERQPPAVLFALNREHVAAEAIAMLAELRSRLFDRIRSMLGSWAIPPMTAWVFGSAARGDGDVNSDIDVIVVRPNDAEEELWEQQVTDLGAAITRWSGNGAAILDYSGAELVDLSRQGEPILAAIRNEGIHLAGAASLPTVMPGPR